MRLFIAKKPKLAKAIVAALGGGNRQNGHIYCGDDKVNQRKTRNSCSGAVSVSRIVRRCILISVISRIMTPIIRRKRNIHKQFW